MRRPLALVSVVLIALLALTALSVAAETPVSEAAAAETEVVLPPEGPWLPCPPEGGQFCVRSLLVNGADVLANDTWRVEAEILPCEGEPCSGSVNWEVVMTSQDWPFSSPPPLESDIALSLNTGDIEPLFTTAMGQLTSLTTSGDDGTGYVLDITGRPLGYSWRTAVDQGNCGIGDCGGDTTAADVEGIVFQGNTQDMAAWHDYERAWFKGMWIGTEAQYFGEPWVDCDPANPDVCWWNLQLGNPHLKMDQVTPMIGTFTSFVPVALLDEAGTTTEEVVARGLQVIRVNGADKEVVGASITAVPGGVVIRIPRIEFSTSTYEFHNRKGRARILQPDPPRALTATPLDGGAVLRFDKPLFDGGSPLVGYDVACESTGEPVTRFVKAAVAVEMTGLTNGQTWMCKARANNALKQGVWTYDVQVQPEFGLPAVPPGASPRIAAELEARALTLRWQAPLSTGGAAITGYRVDVCRSSAPCPDAAKVTKDVSAPARTVTIRTGALDGKYVVVVRALNEVDLGDPARKVIRI